MKLVSENHNMPSLLARISLCFLTFALVSASLVAQPPSKPNRVKEEDEETPRAKQAVPATPVKPRNEPPKLQPITWGPFNLADEAKAVTNPEAKKYLQDLALTADEVVSNTGKVYHTAPISKKYDPKE